MKDIEILYFDVDGTLLDNKNHNVPASTIQSLYELKSKGYKLAVCTGRNKAAIDVVRHIIDWDGYVLSNGCAIYDKDLNALYERAFPTDFVSRMIKASQHPLFLEGDEMYFSKPPHQKLKDALKFFKSDAKIEVLDYNNHTIYNMMSYDFDELDFDIIPDFYDHADVHLDILGNSEIIPKNTGKHLGCDVLNQHLKVTKFAGFGDGENDIEFLKHASVSVAMGNAKDHVKQAANYITSSVDDDGIYNGLKMLGIL